MKTMICLVRVRRHFVPVTFYPIFSPETFFRSNILSQLLHGDILSHFWRATSRPYLGNSFAIILPYIGHISVISRLYLGYISAIPWPHLGQILSISWAYLEHISWAYLSHILSISFHDILYWAVLQGWTMKLLFTGWGGAGQGQKSTGQYRDPPPLTTVRGGACIPAVLGSSGLVWNVLGSTWP